MKWTNFSLPLSKTLCATRRLFIYLSVGLLAGLCKKLQADLAEVFRES